MLRSLIALGCVVASLLARPALARAEGPGCTDLDNCQAVTELAVELDVQTRPRVDLQRVHPPKPPPPGSTPPRRSPSSCSNADLRGASQWPRWKPKVVEASGAVVRISHCETCTPENVGKIQELWARSMLRYVRILSCALESAPAGERAPVVEELRRVFSGAMVAGAGDSTALLALMQKEELGSRTSLSEVLKLYDRLQDPTTRKAFIERLRNFGSADSGFTQKLEQLGTSERVDQDLLDVLLKAERASLAMGLSFVTENELRTRRVQGVRGLQLVIQKNWQPAPPNTPIELSARDFTQGIKQLLTVLTTEGIRPEKQVNDERSGVRSVCECARDSSCKAVLLVQLTQTSTDLAPTGELHFRNDIVERCANPPRSSKAPETIAGPAFARDCSAQQGEAECANDRFKAASQLLNRLSSQFSLFGDVAFLPFERRVETISPTFHAGVRIDEMPIGVSERAPDLLRRGLRVENRGCSKDLHDRLVSRLRNGYAAQIGEPIGSKGRTLLELTGTRPDSCTLRLRDAKNTEVYGFVVVVSAPATMIDAGDDAGRTVGQFYFNLQRAQYLAAKSPSLLPPPRPSPASSFFVAGAPFLTDEQASNDGFGWLYAGVDSLGLVCGGVSAALSVGARNQAETGRDAPFVAAQTYLGLAYGCLAASLLSRAASALHYSAAGP